MTTSTMPDHRVMVDEAGAYVFYQAGFLSAEEATMYYNTLNEAAFFKVETDDYGLQDRATHYMADADCTFSYVGLENRPNKWSKEVMALRKKVEATINSGYSVLTKLNLDGVYSGGVVECKGCLLNKYESGEKHIPWHSDTVTDHGAAKLVATVSLGAPRQIHFRRVLPAHIPGTVAAAAAAAATSQCEPGREPGSLGGGGGDGGGSTGATAVDPEAAVSQLMAPGSLTVMAGTTQELWEHRIPADPHTAEGRISLTFRSMEPILHHRLTNAAGEVKDGPNSGSGGGGVDNCGGGGQYTAR